MRSITTHPVRNECESGQSAPSNSICALKEPEVMPRFKLALVSVALLVGFLLTGFGVYAVLRLAVSDMFGSDIVKSGGFYFADVALSLILYLFLVVFAVRTWDGLRETLRVRCPKRSSTEPH